MWLRRFMTPPFSLTILDSATVMPTPALWIDVDAQLHFRVDHLQDADYRAGRARSSSPHVS